jgi:hypothetical protein
VSLSTISLSQLLTLRRHLPRLAATLGSSQSRKGHSHPGRRHIHPQKMFNNLACLRDRESDRAVGSQAALGFFRVRSRAHDQDAGHRSSILLQLIKSREGLPKSLTHFDNVCRASGMLFGALDDEAQDQGADFGINVRFLSLRFVGGWAIVLRHKESINGRVWVERIEAQAIVTRCFFELVRNQAHQRRPVTRMRSFCLQCHVFSVVFAPRRDFWQGSVSLWEVTP